MKMYFRNGMKRLMFLGFLSLTVILFHHPRQIIEYVMLFVACVLFLIHFKKYLKEN